jgi:ABC-type Fe3+ transport system permease subunit
VAWRCSPRADRVSHADWRQGVAEPGGSSAGLRARRGTIFSTISLPLMRPGIANAFLLGFVESLADFGNPLVLGGNFEVLSTKIFYAVVGSAHDRARAAVLAIVLLAFTLGVFYAQHRWLGRRSYTSLTGKGDAGLPAPLPRAVAWLCYGFAVPWVLLTIVTYATILVGGLSQRWGAIHPNPAALPDSVLDRSGRRRSLVYRVGVGLAVDDDRGLGDCRAVHDAARPVDRIPSVAPSICRAACLRVRDDA